MGGINKQYLDVGGMSVLARSVKAFEKNAYTDEIIIAVRAGDEDNCMQTVVSQHGMRKVKAVVAGGPERQDSVKKALSAVAEDCGIVLVHDGARPFVTQRLIHDVIAAADRRGSRGSLRQRKGYDQDRGERDGSGNSGPVQSQSGADASGVFCSAFERSLR